MWESHNTVHGRLAVQDANVVGEIVENAQVVLYYNDIIIWAKKTLVPIRQENAPIAITQNKALLG